MSAAQPGPACAQRNLIRQRGSMTVVAAAVASAILLLAVALGAAVQAGTTRSKAQAVADVAAVTAAQMILDGSAPANACKAATRLITANPGTVPGDCSVHLDGTVLVRVTVAAPVHLPLLGQRTTMQTALAGESG